VVSEHSKGRTIQVGDSIIERKIRYDSGVVEHQCRLLDVGSENIVLFHKIVENFTMTANGSSLTIPEGSYTLAYYWKDRPYNLYIWRNQEGKYLGSYFNIIKNSYINDGIVSFEDLIIDVLVLDNGEAYVLDEDELPLPLEEFEAGSVKESLQGLLNDLDTLLPQIISETTIYFPHEDLHSWIR
jgi:uncharacterized protein